MNDGVAELIANNLGNLKLADGTPVQVAGYGNSGLPMAQEVAEVRRRASVTLGQALVNLIEGDGNTILRNDEYAVLQQSAAVQEVREPISMYCNCGALLFTITQREVGRAQAPATLLDNALRAHLTTCPHASGA